MSLLLCWPRSQSDKLRQYSVKHPTSLTSTRSVQILHAPFVEALVCLACSICSFSPRPPLGKPGPSATACSFETEAPPAANCRFGQVVLGDLAAGLAGME